MSRALTTRTFNRLASLILALLLAPAAIAATYYVDDDAPNDPGPGDPTVSDPDEDGSAAHPFDAIQEGIDAATTAGDQVTVLPGTYSGIGNYDLHFNGVAIAVVSPNYDPEDVTINCQGDGCGFRCNNNENTNYIISGFTIINGSGVTGGGIRCGGFAFPNPKPGSPSISNCIVRNCSAQKGGGMSCENGSAPHVYTTTFEENTAAGGLNLGYGGGVYAYESTPQFFGCRFYNNTTSGLGGSTGGGAYLETNASQFDDCIFAGNSTSGSGGGLSVPSGDPTLNNCTVVDNAAGAHGGGLYISGSLSNASLTNCTFDGNHADLGGSAIANTYYALTTATRCIFASHTGSVAFFYITANNINCNCCDLWNNAAGDGTYGGSNNFAGDPLYCSPNDPDYELTIMASSPCAPAHSPCSLLVGAGEVDCTGVHTVVCEPQSSPATTHPPHYWYEVTADTAIHDFHVRVYDNVPDNYSNWIVPDGWLYLLQDIDGEIWASWCDPELDDPITGTVVFGFDNDNDSRWGHWRTTNDGFCNPATGIVDQSENHAGEDDGYGYRVHVPERLTPHTWTVCPDGTADFTTIQPALDSAWPGDTVELCDATYSGDGNRDLTYRGKDLIVVSASDNPDTCIIDCGGTEESPHRGFHFNSGETRDALLRSIKITDGWADWPGGGAILIEEVPDSAPGIPSSPTIENCVLEQNFTDSEGGGMHVRSSQPDVHDCAFRQNLSLGIGGGLGIGWVCEGMDLARCEFYENIAEDDGGGLGQFSQVHPEDCVFVLNDCRGHGGGATAMGGADGALFQRCWFARNSASGMTWNAGGGVSIFADNLSFEWCTFASNTATSEGGGVYIGDGPNYFRNCTFYGNAAPSGGGLFAYTPGGSVALEYTIVSDSTMGAAVIGNCSLHCCDIWNNASGPGSAGTWIGNNFNIAADPLYCGAASEDFTIDYASPCAPPNSPCGMLIGAHDVGCGQQPWCLGDMNCSGGSPDFADILYFAAAIGNEPGWVQYYGDHHGGEVPPCPWLLGDYTGGGVEFTDIVPFANSIGQSCILYAP